MPGSCGPPGHQFSPSEGDFPASADVLAGRQRHRPAEQGGRGGQSASVAGALRGRLQICGELLIGCRCGSSAVPDLLVSVTVAAADRAEQVVRASPGGVAGPVVDRRADQRMPEPQRIAGCLDQFSRLRFGLGRVRVDARGGGRLPNPAAITGDVRRG